jgi:hypothetical protein
MKTITLPRQARDKHRESTQKRVVAFFAGKRKDQKVFKVFKRKPTEMKNVVCEDISGGLERRPIPCFNEVDDEKLPESFK